MNIPCNHTLDCLQCNCCSADCTHTGLLVSTSIYRNHKTFLSDSTSRPQEQAKTHILNNIIVHIFRLQAASYLTLLFLYFYDTSTAIPFHFIFVESTSTTLLGVKFLILICLIYTALSPTYHPTLFLCITVCVEANIHTGSWKALPLYMNKIKKSKLQA